MKAVSQTNKATNQKYFNKENCKMTYMELEQKLKKLPKMEPITIRFGGNFITPWIVGYVKINDNLKAEISYGTGVSPVFLIGFTIFKDGQYSTDANYQSYNKCFNSFQFEELEKYIEKVSSELK